MFIQKLQQKEFRSLSIPRDKSAAIKGFLICLIVLGHNLFFNQAIIHGVYDWLYSFHVACFFFLPFFYADHSFSIERSWTYCKRLLWPYFYMFLILFFLNALFTKQLSLGGLANTLVTGNFYKLGFYVGFEYIWFLPAMFSMLVIKDIHTSANKHLKTTILIIGFIFFILSWVFLINSPYGRDISSKIACFSIFSFMLGFAMFFLGTCVKFVVENFNINLIILVLATIMMLVSVIVTFGEIPEVLYARWTARIFNPIIIFYILVNTSWYNIKVFRMIGEVSLPFYLLHQPISFAICQVFNKSGLDPFVSLTVSYILTMIATYLVVKCAVSKQSISRFLFPR